MNREKTGTLIGAARKEKNMTQKELAAVLHVSDRAVSKWERGAGFPDVS
ncbi:MAG: helix-turn-helix transcriptional regulator, partial [Oscillospiraceae bacterium]|nr:helix-turn-helix transcriptional regulator [Oscillospiraceae bacterium]